MVTGHCGHRGATVHSAVALVKDDGSECVRTRDLASAVVTVSAPDKKHSSVIHIAAQVMNVVQHLPRPLVILVNHGHCY